MDTEPVHKRVADYRARLFGLLDSRLFIVAGLAADRGAHSQPGGYAISTPDDTTLVYVVRRKTKSIAGRIADHRSGSGDKGSDLRDKLKLNPQMSPQIDDYRIRYVVVQDDQDRLFFEHFAIGCFAPCLNK